MRSAGPQGASEAWDECHESVRGSVMSSQVTMWLASFYAMLWVQSATVGSSRHHMLCLPEAELVQLQCPGDLQ